MDMKGNNMKAKLKTLERLKKEFGFKEDVMGIALHAKYKNHRWFILKEEMKYLGKEIEVGEFTKKGNYTHISKGKNWVCYWHELWFEAEDFIDESEFNI